MDYFYLLMKFFTGNMKFFTGKYKDNFIESLIELQ